MFDIDAYPRRSGAELDGCDGLQGRRRECASLDRLLQSLREGQSRVLVIHGEAGVGKSALLEYALGAGSALRTVRAVGVELEMELPFSGLQQLCAPLSGHLDQLPQPQRDALETAFGLSARGKPDRFLIGLGVLNLLSSVAQEQPLLCVVDDAQWLDRSSTQVLSFVARRLATESVGFVFAVREPSRGRGLDGLPTLRLKGLAPSDARELLASGVAGRLDERVADRIVSETRGNPLALLELPRGWSPAELAGGFGLPHARSLSARIEQSFLRQLERLPEETRVLLLVGASEPLGEPLLLWRAAERLGLPREAAVPAEDAGLLKLGARVRFRHPLLRSAVYRTASVGQRRAAHRALAEATDASVDPDRRAWHRAQATLGPNEEIAAELERSASRAQARGGLAAGAAFLEQAAALTPDPGRRVERSLAAAQAQRAAGAPDAARELLVAAEAGPLDERQRALLELLRGQLTLHVTRGGDASAQLLEAAKSLEAHDVDLAREAYLYALDAATFAGRLNDGYGLREAAEAVRDAAQARAPKRPVELLLDGLATRVLEGQPAGAPLLQQAVAAFRLEPDINWLCTVCRTAMDLWDDEAWLDLSTRQIQLADDAGALASLPMALALRAGAHTLAGEFAAAQAVIEQCDAVTAATGAASVPYARQLLAAYRGREADALELIDADLKDAAERGEGGAITLSDYAAAILQNGLGRYETAFESAKRASGRSEPGWAAWAQAELIEAAARSGRTDDAAEALERLAEQTLASGTNWALGLEARCRALVSQDDAVEELYREAIDRLGQCVSVVDLARAYLLYGEWLRRQNRRRDAREQLRRAHELFRTIGAEAFEERALRELRATGATARKRSAETRGQLTVQEAQIAQLARDGHSNTEIGGRLFISPRTVEYHLHKVFAKLAISSRNQLEGSLPNATSHPQDLAAA